VPVGHRRVLPGVEADGASGPTAQCVKRGIAVGEHQVVGRAFEGGGAGSQRLEEALGVDMGVGAVDIGHGSGGQPSLGERHDSCRVEPFDHGTGSAMSAGVSIGTCLGTSLSAGLSADAVEPDERVGKELTGVLWIEAVLDIGSRYRPFTARPAGGGVKAMGGSKACGSRACGSRACDGRAAGVGHPAATGSRGR
jgi:hypothetical protein